jgi:hypothetical protein
VDDLGTPIVTFSAPYGMADGWNGNRVHRLIVSNHAGARAFAFGFSEYKESFVNMFTSVGALRDDVLIQPPLSTTDKIGKYTRTFPAGMFNRPYTATIVQDRGTKASATFTYDAPDVVPSGAHFARTITFEQAPERFIVDESVHFNGTGPLVAMQRGVVLSSIASGGMTLIDDRAHDAIGWYGNDVLFAVAWRHDDMDDVSLIPEATSTVIRFVLATGGVRRTSYAIFHPKTLEDAQAILRSETTNLNERP